jgi:hypothetical protein
MSEDPKVVEAIKADFDGQWGDRRQEIVFIGESLDVEAVTKAVDACLLTEAEWRMWQRVSRYSFICGSPFIGFSPSNHPPWWSLRLT